MLNWIIKNLEERIPVEKISYESLVVKKEVPVHKASWVYYLGGLTMFCFIIQIATGLLLLPYYQPNFLNANESINYINFYVPNGFFVRNLHSWASSFMIFFVTLHLLTVLATKSFLKPRDLTWMTGFILLIVTLGFGFTGYLLPWSQISVNATKVGMEILQSSTGFLPGVFKLPGEFLASNLRGGPTVAPTTLSRFFVIHVVILPFLIFALVAVHLFFVQLHGMNKEGFVTKKLEKFFPDFFMKDLILWLCLFFVLLLIAQTLPFDAFLPYPLKAPYIDNSPTPSGIEPEWYFLFLFYPLELFSKTFILILSAVVFLILFLAPVTFKRFSIRVLTIIALVSFIYLFISTCFGKEVVHFLRK